MIKELFGILSNGEKVYKYTITNGIVTLSVIERGAAITRLNVFGIEALTGFDRLEDYVADTSYQGAVVGRVANRIKDSSFEMDGKIYKITANDGKHSLHGGSSGFSKKLWRLTDSDESTLTFSYLSPDKEEGYPSTVDVRVKYSLTDLGILIEYTALPQGKTPISLTNHSYFNLSGIGGDILSHEAIIYADRYTEVDGELIPTGIRPNTKDSDFDFTTKKKLGHVHKDGSVGYDHNFFISPTVFKEFQGKTLALAANVKGSLLSMSVYTDQPCIQLYTGNFLGDPIAFCGGKKQIKHGAFCIEAQTEPNSVNLGKCFYSTDEAYTQLTAYEFLRVTT